MPSLDSLALGSRDSGGRTPLHFAAEYGVSAVVEVIVHYLKAWNMFNVKEGIDGTFWQDTKGGHLYTLVSLVVTPSRHKLY